MLSLHPTRFVLALVVLAPLTAAAAGPPTKAPIPTSEGSKPTKGGGRGATAHLGPPASPERRAAARSVGSPTEGRIVGGAHLATSPYLRIYPVYSQNDFRWGVDSLVGLVDRAAKTVRKQYPDAVCSVGHLSKRGGGELERHASHESGRDADVGFYVRDGAGKPLLADHMVPFTSDGTSPSWPGAHFDDARNWALVAALVGDGHSHVTHLFVATPLRDRLLAYAAKIGAPPALRSRAAAVLAQPHGSLPHDDHFHVRIACPPGMDQCVEHPLAHRQGHPSALASNGHPRVGRRGAPPAGSHAAPAAGHGAPSAAPGRRPGKPERHDDHEAAHDSLVPSLSPSVAGLDSAVIPAPLGRGLSTWGTSKDEAAPISDPDGVLEEH